MAASGGYRRRDSSTTARVLLNRSKSSSGVSPSVRSASARTRSCHSGERDGKYSVQVMALAVDSWPAAIKVMTFARISCRVSLPPVSADAWNKVGKVEKIEGINSSETIEVAAHCCPQIVSADEQAGGKNGALEHIEREIGSLFCNVEHDTVTLGPAPDQLIDRGHHRRRHVLDHARSEKRCDQPPLRIPLRIFRRQQAPAENGEDPLLKAILAIVCLILLEDPTDCGRIVHNDDVTEWKAGPHDRFFKMSLCPSLYWITP